jgi:hypothetical protein
MKMPGERWQDLLEDVPELELHRCLFVDFDEAATDLS